MRVTSFRIVSSEPPKSFEAWPKRGSFNGGLGFIAAYKSTSGDYSKPSFGSYSPGGSTNEYSGDYFLPGSPVEGWGLQWKRSSSTKRYMMKARINMNDFGVSQFQQTSQDWKPGDPDKVLSALWVGERDQIKVSKIIKFQSNKRFFTTTVTLENTGTTSVSDIYYQRTVDPDQGQPWCGLYDTNNYIKYQSGGVKHGTGGLGKVRVESARTLPDGTTEYAPWALVVAEGPQGSKWGRTCNADDRKKTMGLGTIHKNARVTTFGFHNNYPATSWNNGASATYLGYSEASPSYRDQAVDLVFKFDEIAAGASESFTYAYILSIDDLDDAMESVTNLVIQAPGDVVSGSNAEASVLIPDAMKDKVTSITFTISKGAGAPQQLCTTSGTAAPSALSTSTFGTCTSFPTCAASKSCEKHICMLPAADEKTSFSCRWDSSNDAKTPNGADYQFSAVIKLNDGQTLDAAKPFEVSNNGPRIRFIKPKKPHFPHTSKTELEVEFEAGGAASIKTVQFFKRVTVFGSTSKKPISTATTSTGGVPTGAGWKAELDVSDLPAPPPGGAGQTVYVDAVATSPGGLTYQVVFEGQVAEVNVDPTDVSLSGTKKVFENAGAGFSIGTLSTVDGNPYDSHTYKIVGGNTADYQIDGASLQVKNGLNYEDAGSTAGETIEIQTEDGGTCEASYSDGGKTYSNRCILPAEVAASTRIKPWCIDTAGSLKSCKMVKKRESRVRIQTDDGRGGTFEKDFVITIEDVNEAPTGITLRSCTSGKTCSGSTLTMNENLPTGTAATLLPSDPDYTDYARSPLASSCSAGADGGGLFGVTTGCELQIKSEVDFESAVVVAGEITITATVQDAAANSYTETFKMKINNVNERPTDVTLTGGNTIDEEMPAGTPIGTLTATDPDAGDTHSFRIDAPGSSDFEIVGNKLQTKRKLDYEEAGYGTDGFPVKINLKIIANDGTLDSIARNIEVFLNDVPEPPSVSGTDFDIDENSRVDTVVGIITGSVLDAGKDLEYFIMSGNRNNAFRLDKCSGMLLVETQSELNYEKLNKDGKLTYSMDVEVRVKETCDTPTSAACKKASATVTVTVQPINEQPYLSNAAITVDEGKTDGMAILQIKAGTLAQARPAPSAAVPDTVYYYDPDNENLDLAAPADAAIIDKGLFTLDEGGGAFQLASKSTGTWKVCPAAGCAYTKDGIQIQVKGSALDFETQKTYSLTIKVVDTGTPKPLDQYCTVSITVRDINEPPQFDVPGFEFNVDENSAKHTLIGYKLKATDEDTTDRGNLKYSLADDKGGLFEIGATSGQLAVATGATLNHEGVPKYTLTVQATDLKGASGSANVEVSVNDVNEPPSFVDTADPILATVSEGAGEGTEVTTLDVIDPDAGESETFSVLSVDPPSATGIFKLTSDTGKISVLSTTNLDHEWDTGLAEGKNKIKMTTRITDRGGLTMDRAVLITVTDVNEPPTLPDLSFEVAEDANVDTNLFFAGSFLSQQIPICAQDEDFGSKVTLNIESDSSISAAQPAGIFKLAADTGTCKDRGVYVTVGVAGVLDFEGASQQYTLVVSASDGTNPVAPMKIERTYKITVVDANDPPTFDAGMVRRVGENSVAPAPVGAPIVANDPDTNGKYNIKAYSLTGGSGALAGTYDTIFEIVTSGSDGQIKLKSATKIDQLWPRTGGKVTVEVEDNAGAKASADVSIELTEQNDRPTLADATFTGAQAVPEDKGAGHQIGSLVATDPDTTQKLTYEITLGNDLDVFAINKDTGDLTVNKDNMLDFETKPKHVLQVKVTDDGCAASGSCLLSNRMSDTATITVDIADVNEAPTFADAVRSVSENSAGKSIVGAPVTAVDVGSDPCANDPCVEGTEITYQLCCANKPGCTVSGCSKSSLDYFEIDETTGQILTKEGGATLDYESESSYQVKVIARDNGKPLTQSAEATVTIAVTNANDAPVASNPAPFSIDENSVAGSLVGTFAATDQDAADELTYEFAFKLVKQAGAKAPVEIQVKDSQYLNYEAKETFGFTVLVSDKNKKVAKAFLRVKLNDVNESPAFPTLSTCPAKVGISDPHVACYEISERVAGNELLVNGDFAGGRDIEGGAAGLSAGGDTFKVESVASGPNGAGTFALKLDASTTRANMAAPVEYKVSQQVGSASSAGITSIGTNGNMRLSFWAKVSADYDGSTTLARMQVLKTNGAADASLLFTVPQP
eukprot:g3254.t1